MKDCLGNELHAGDTVVFQNGRNYMSVGVVAEEDYSGEFADRIKINVSHDRYICSTSTTWHDASRFKPSYVNKTRVVKVTTPPGFPNVDL